MRRIVRFIAIAVWALSLSTGSALGSLPPAQNVVGDARASEVDGDVRSAIGRREPYVAAHPKDADAARLLGDLYFRNSEPIDAEAAWQAEIRRNPNDRETHERLGSFYAATNRLPDAINELERSLPSRAGLLALIDVQRRTNGLDAFVADARTGASRNPYDPWQLTRYATVLEVTHHPDEALRYDTRVVDLAPAPDCEALVGRAVDLLALQREPGAVIDLRACLRTNPDDYAALTILALTYLHPGAYDQARPLLGHALKVLPYGVEALIDLGYLEDATGDGDGAALCYRKALAGDPLRPEPYIDLGFDYAARRSYAQAEAMYSAGLTADPGSGRLHYLLGWAYRSEGKYALAQTQFEAALSADEADVVDAARAALATLPNSAG
jgi:tetratricopeptide (TPR) repeat protein